MQPGVGLASILEPGEAVIMNNYVIMHGRTAFEDGEERGAKRHLLRLWLTAQPPRPVVPELAVFASEREGKGIAPQPGRIPSYDDHETVHKVYGQRMPRL